MAKKGQEFNKVSDEIKENIVSDCLKYYESIRTVGKKYGTSHNAVQTIKEKYRKCNCQYKNV